MLFFSSKKEEKKKEKPELTEEKFVKALQSVINEDKMEFTFMDNTRIKYFTSYFMADSYTPVKLFLNKPEFEVLYPVLKETLKNPNVELIVSDEVLKNEETQLFELSPNTNPEDIKLFMPQRLSEIEGYEKAHIVDKNNLKDLPSFIVIGHSHSAIMTDEGNFITCINGDTNYHQSKKIEKYINVFNLLKTYGSPVPQIQPLFLASQRKLPQQGLLREARTSRLID